MKRFLQNLILVVCILVFCYSGFQLFRIWQEYRAGDQIYDSIKEQVSLPEETESSAETADTGLDVPKFLVNLDLLQQTNPDTIGWIEIPDTAINYPILQAEDNLKYLRRTITGEANKAGCIFVDYREEHPFAQASTIVYGHNLLNGKMFSNLMKYEDASFWKEHPYIYIQTGDGVQVYQIYSCYRCDEDSPVYSFGLEAETEVFGAYLNQTLDQAAYQTGITPGEKDSILTLSTCTNEYDTERFVVHGVRLPLR